MMSLVAFALAVEAPPYPETQEAAPLDGDASGFGAGIILGVPTGITVAYKPGQLWFDAAFAWSFEEGRIHVHADALVTVDRLVSDDMPDLAFPVYVGVGPRFRFAGPSTPVPETHIGVRVPIGMGFEHEGLPVEAFVEVAPGVGLYPDTRAVVDVALGARFYFL